MSELPIRHRILRRWHVLPFLLLLFFFFFLGYPFLHLNPYFFPSLTLSLAHAITAKPPSHDLFSVFPVCIPLFFALIDLMKTLGTLGSLDMRCGKMGVS